MSLNHGRSLSWAAALIVSTCWLASISSAQRPLGIDVSHWNGVIDWNRVATSGVSFAWCKATEHTSYVDNTYVYNQTNAARNGILLGPYHFARPDLNLGVAGAVAEADHFWNTTSNYIKGSNTYFMPMLDVETREVTNTTPVYTKATLSQWVNAWCSNLVMRAAAAGVAVKPVIYTGGSYSLTYLNTSVTNWPLWVPNWNGQDPQTGGPASTGVWPSNSWAFWQYSATGSVSGVSGDCDLDVYHGTSNTLSAYSVGAPIAPYFIEAPINHRVADSGTTVRFVSVVGGTPPLKYQWASNGVPIPGWTNAVLNLANVQTNYSANYSLSISNSVGNLTSKTVSLRVYPLQAVVFADSFDTNGAGNWILNRSSADTQVEFAFDYSAVGIPAAPNSAGGTRIGVQMKANLASGAAAALSLSPTNRTFTGDYRLRFDAWINVNGPFPDGGNGSTLYLTAGVGTSGNRTQWPGAGSTADGYYFAMDGEGGVSVGSSGDYNVYSNVTLMATNSGVYAAGIEPSVRDDENPYYVKAFPDSRTAPALQTLNFPQQGSNALDPGTIGFAWHDVIVSRRGNVVDWAVDGIRFATISNATATASNVFFGFWDAFPSLSSNTAINFGLVDNVRVEQPAVAPFLTAQAQSLWAPIGGSANFTASATGLPAPAFQWRFNGTNISGATNSSLSLASLAGTNAGLYSVLITNIAGSQTSSNALLSLIASTPPTMQLVGAPGSVQLNCFGEAGATYALETSTNLSAWITLTNLVASGAVFSIIQPVSPVDSLRYYRLRSGP